VDQPYPLAEAGCSTSPPPFPLLSIATAIQGGDPSPGAVRACLSSTWLRQLLSLTPLYPVGPINASHSWYDGPPPCRKVVFNDTLGGAELSAVQVDRESSYKAEDTSFLGFYGEVRI